MSQVLEEVSGLAKGDNRRQAKRGLTVEQLNAIDLLVTGVSDREVGEKVGVARQTINNWRLHHLGFQAQLNRQREEVWSFSKDRMRALVPKALDRIEKTLEDDEDQSNSKVALEVLKAAGLHSAAECSFDSFEPDDPRMLAKAIAKKRRNESSGLLGDPFWEPSDDDIDGILEEMQAKGA